jgi:hypothetical protein
MEAAAAMMMIRCAALDRRSYLFLNVMWGDGERAELPPLLHTTARCDGGWMTRMMRSITRTGGRTASAACTTGSTSTSTSTSTENCTSDSVVLASTIQVLEPSTSTGTVLLRLHNFTAVLQ